MAKISVIVPVYRLPAGFDRCIASLLAQDWADYELLLISNGGCEDTVAACRDHAEHDPGKVRHLDIPEAGVSRARNLGLEEAGGAYIAFADADDYVEHDWLSRMAENLERTGSDISIVSYFTETCGANDCRSAVSSKHAGPLDREQLLHHIYISGEIGGFLWNKLFRRAFIGDVRLDESLTYCEDSDFLFRLLEREPKMHYEAIPLYHYVHGADSLTSSAARGFSPEGELYIDLAAKRLLSGRLALTDAERQTIQAGMFFSCAYLRYQLYLQGQAEKKDLLTLKRIAGEDRSAFLRSGNYPASVRIRTLLQYALAPLNRFRR